MKTQTFFQNRTITILFVLIVTVASTLLPVRAQTVRAKSLYSPFTTCSAQSEIPTAECDALVALYLGTDGANWYVNTNWLQTDTPCDWAGVVCTAGRVTGLLLHDNNLVGTIPSIIGNLTELTTLLLGGNSIVGAVPISLLSLVNLTTISLGCTVTAVNPALVLLLTGLLGSGWNTNCPNPPANDDIFNATIINVQQFTNTIDVSDATTALDDPLLSCGSAGSGSHSVWYVFTPSVNGNLTLDTFGSTYNTVLVVWGGTRGNLVSNTCNDDSGGSQSLLSLGVSTGQTYVIEVAGSNSSGMLTLNTDFQPASAPTATNTVIPVTATATATPTNTDIPTLVPTATATATQTATSTVVITPTNTATPTHTATATRTATPTPMIYARTFLSLGTWDGWVLESNQLNNHGGAMGNQGVTTSIGDNAANREYRSMLTFKTDSIPDNAIITGVALHIRKDGNTGSVDPMMTLGGFIVEVKKGPFGTMALELGDFDALTGGVYGPFRPDLIKQWYTLNITSSRSFINKLPTMNGLTQIRIKLNKGSNDDKIANLLKFYSGDAAEGWRPRLIIRYRLP